MTIHMTAVYCLPGLSSGAAAGEADQRLLSLLSGVKTTRVTPPFRYHHAIFSDYIQYVLSC